MDNKKLGLIIIVLTILFATVMGFFRFELEKQIKSQITYDNSGQCIHEVGKPCPFQELSKLFLPTLIGGVLLALFLALGVYLIFFEKSQKAIIDTLKETKEKEIGKEKFDLVLSALNEDEKKVMTAVKEQDGISQTTLVMRTDFSKAKLSLILKDLENKELIKKVTKGKINYIYLKKQF